MIDWSDSDIWDYIHTKKLPINPLYCEGWKRVGCIGCPMAGKSRSVEFSRYPQYERLYISAFDRMLETRRARGLPCDWESGADVFRWWMEDKNVAGQISIEDLMEGEQDD